MTQFKKQKPRTCIACREESVKRALIRIVRSPDGKVIFDPTGKLPGRGAYLCPNTECLAKAIKTGALARALKINNLSFDYSELESYIKNYAAQRTPEVKTRELKSLLGLARRASLLEIGMDNIKSAVKNTSKALLILTVQDCSESINDFAESLVLKRHERLTLPFDVEALSEALGTGKVQVIALPVRNGLADKIRILL